MKLRALVRRYGWLVLLVCVAVPLIRWWTGRDQAERVSVVSSQYMSTNIPDYYLRLNPDKTYSIIEYDMLARQRAERELARATLTEGGEQNIPPLTLAGDYLYFMVDQSKRPRATLGMRATMGSGFPGAAPHLLKKPIITHLTRKPDSILARLCRVPRKGGPVEEVWRDANTRTFAVVGDDLYWIRGRPESVTSVWDGIHYQETVTPKSDLMQTSLRTHTTRLIATGLPLYTPLFSGREAVYWTKYARPNAADAVSELWRYAPAQPAPQCIMQGYKDYKPPFEADGRLYWVSTDMGDSQIGGSNIPKNASLYSAKPDGSGRRLVLELVTDKRPKWAGYRFLTYDNRLYALLKDPPDTGPNSYISDLPTRLYRVREHATPMLRPIFKIPPKTYENVLFDRGYFYFTRHEEQEEWLHWSAPVQGKNVLYRFRLPED